MPVPSVKITLGNGNLGQVSSSSDAVAGMILTGKAVGGKLELNKHYQLASTRDLTALGVAAADNFLVDKEVKAFYKQAREGAELHLLVVSEATTLTTMCAAEADSPLSKLMDAAGDRICLLGVNKIAPAEYEAGITQGIDPDAITAAEAAQQSLDSYAGRIRPVRLFMPACGWDGTTENLFKPVEGSYNRVYFVMASDDPTCKSASVGQFLGCAASRQVHQSLGRVRSGAVASQGWLTNGKSYLEMASLADTLHDAGYGIYIKYPTRNGCYISSDHMAAPDSDDYCKLYLGRVVDKAMKIVYDTYLDEIKENVQVDEDGYLPEGACTSYENAIENAIGAQMGDQISDFEAEIDREQNILSTGEIRIKGRITPQGVIDTIEFGLSLANPALTQ